MLLFPAAVPGHSGDPDAPPDTALPQLFFRQIFSAEDLRIHVKNQIQPSAQIAEPDPRRAQRGCKRLLSATLRIRFRCLS